MVTQVPKLFDLVAEKMRPDEDFVTFANRWRSIASRADVTIPESQDIIMIVDNTTSQLKSILILSEFTSFAHLYNRARVIQNQIKDSSLPPFFEGKPKGRKAPAAPTTEGVTVNESVSACSQPLRPPNKSSNRPSNLHQFPSHPSKPYSVIPPPSDYTRLGPKRSHYTPLPEILEDVFFALMSCDTIRLPPQRESVNPRTDTSKYCPYHRTHGHELHNCFTFRYWVYDMNDQDRINWEDLKVAIAKSRYTKRDLGIVQNPLPNHQSNNPSSSKSQENVHTMTHSEPRVMRREQRWGVEGFEEWYSCPSVEFEEPSTTIDDILEERPLVLIRPAHQEVYPSVPTPLAYESSTHGTRPLQLILPRSHEDVHVTHRNQIVPPLPRPSQDEEDNGPPPHAGTEYDILQHLDKTPARVSILELIRRSPSHQSTLLQFLQKIMVNDGLPPSRVTNAILSLNQGPSISFPDKDLVAPECRSLPLCLTITLNEVSVDSTLINTGASINMSHLFIPDKGKKPIMSIFDLPSPLDLSQPPIVDEEFEHVPCPQGKGWEVMAKIGYIHGRGLGRNEWFKNHTM
ncbi:hypothetical protein Taro_036542 [Colocasia esculenta]|uniref:G-patch domain-containing protein n=1 Tax=Colocasia esculenta TaxID=4460 RepID=A0A843W741_COLES|nr:hypothetical protein [Colocasia esculenta]